MNQDYAQVRREVVNLEVEALKMLCKLEAQQKVVGQSLKDSFNRRQEKIKAFNPLPKCPFCGNQDGAEHLECFKCKKAICRECAGNCGPARYCTNKDAAYCKNCSKKVLNRYLCTFCGNSFCGSCKGPSCDVCCECWGEYYRR